MSLAPRARSQEIDFDRDVRPILSDNCFYCHGADASHRKAKLRLDVPAAAVELKDIVPGQPDASELVKRLYSAKDDEHMPPPSSNRHVSDDQKLLLKRWIASGAKYEPHWAFVAPVRPKLPSVKDKKWARNPIDDFILAKLESQNLKPSPPAPMERLLRRVSLDLNGLPPTSEQLSRWLAKKDPYSTAVDELLASPHFGEREASDWMDTARYADTHGFNNDSMRYMWRWRDWVINAFNHNLPYDQFITEQLAGDELDHPTLDQLIATGFNRNGVVNSEGGIIDEEYRVEYVVDRVRTTSQAWLGLTMECCRCHDHKFDPITQKDFYRFYAFFNNVGEVGEDGRLGNAAPLMYAPTPKDQGEMADRKKEMIAADAEMQHLLRAQSWKNVSFSATLAGTNPPAATNEAIALKLISPKTNSFSNSAGGKPFKLEGQLVVTNGLGGESALLFTDHSGLKTEKLPEFKAEKGWAFSTWVRRDRAQTGVLFSTMNYQTSPGAGNYGVGTEVRLTDAGNLEVRLTRRWPGYSVDVLSRDTIPLSQWRNILVTCDGQPNAKGLRFYLDGEEIPLKPLHDDFGEVSLTGKCDIGHSTEPGTNQFIGAMADLRLFHEPIDRKQLIEASRQEVIRRDLENLAADAVPSEALKRAWLTQNNAQFAKAAAQFEKSRAELFDIERNAPTTMVMAEQATVRPTFLLSRGVYNQPREQVEPGIPEFLPAFSQSPPRTRLELAHWFTDPRNPLTARVVVNRFWQGLFGTGIVKTSENFGYQADWPSHRQLLDWLATEFVADHWDVKKLLRLMVTSAAYRQNSDSTPELNELDPENRLIAHGPRQRLTAEMIRDQALVLSGLLHDELGGPPVYPYQPKDLYKGIVVENNFPGTVYKESTGPELYRRSVYSFWKRTVPLPTLATFDEPEREVCIARRSKTNTPQQALALMNDTIQLEAARKLAERMLTEGGTNPSDRLKFAFELATARKPKPAEQEILGSLLEKRLVYYHTNEPAARDFLAGGESKPNPVLDPAELAGYANVASLILNLDETIVRD